jgi:hypothetical protein
VRDTRLAGLHLLVLCSFAIAQPLFDLLGKNGEFFGARGSTRWDVVLFALALVLVPPALLLGLELATPRRARGVVHAVFVAVLVGLVVLQAIHALGGPGWLLAAIAGAAGVVAAALYARLPAARLVVTVLAPAPLLFLALFLLDSDASRLTLSGTPSAYAARERPRAPVVVVVFDELPVNSLLDRRGRVDPVRFPHFAALERESTWFANESVVSEGTLHGVPSLLTGLYPRPGELPLYHDHPRNLFTLLGGGADLHVAETETHLCPPTLCHGSGRSLGGRLGSLYADTSIVYLHTLLPDDLARGIPSVSNGWTGFWNSAGAPDPSVRFRRFLPTIRPTTRPALWYLHLLLPHSPWRFLPSGKRYELRPAPGWSAAEVWNDNQAAVDQYWQRHLLQLAYADRVLGTLVARLRATGLYDRALLVVTADEGLSFRAGQKRRPASAANLQDIAYVPLFVKLPHERRGRVVRAPTRSVDVLPTIAAVLGVQVPWRVDGHDALSPAAPRERFVSVAKDHGRRFVVPVAELEARRKAALRRQLGLFGSDKPAGTLYAVGRYRSLLGRRLPGLAVRPGGRAELDSLDLSTDPVQVSGRVPVAAHDVTVAADGRVIAVVPAAQGRFWALVPAAGLGRAAPELFSIEGPGRLRRLELTKT